MLTLVTASFLGLAASATPPCSPATGDAAAVLRRTSAVTGLSAATAAGRVLRVQGFDVESQDYQSDRWYPPYLSNVGTMQDWYAPATGVERRASRISMAGYDYANPTTIGDEHATFIVRDSGLAPNEALHASMYATRALNVWAVLGDWIRGGGARVAERCMYREYSRLVLTRTGMRGPEKLFVDEKSGFPVKLDRIEPHYLWGQSHVEYVYSTWIRVGEASLPGVSFRVADGLTNVERNVTHVALVSGDSAPRLALPAVTAPMHYGMAEFLVGSRPDTTRVGPNAFILRNRGYGEMVVRTRDTVFLFDATQGEDRARNDSAWIDALFPGRLPIALVVTDLAWPHVAGVRFWVAHGATVYAHRAAWPMLDSVVSRRWTLAPDALERNRARARLRFVPVADSLRLAGGDLLVFAIDGVASEVALAAFDQTDRVLWASDYIQSASEPTLYLDEVCRAVTRVARTPDRAAAEHLRVTPWEQLRAMANCSS
ncbi:MAG TPA: hypothetical protein VL524_17485 [Gemmatimonadaceae bacterium]|nr:hypothetical protein [Gemmatimonadaceae bacterium]